MSSEFSHLIDQAIDHFSIAGADSRYTRNEHIRQMITPSARRDGFMNIVTWAHDPARSPAEIIDAGIAPYLANGTACWWVVRPSEAALEPALVARGFLLDHEAYGLVIGTDAGPSDFAPGVTVEELGESNLEDYISVWATPATNREPIRQYLREVMERERGKLSCFLARYEGTPAGAGVVDRLPGFGNLGSAFVREEFRRRGIYRSLVAHRLGVLRAESIPVGVVLAKQATSGPILKRIGFRVVSEFKVFARPAGFSPPAGSPLSQ
ncbi:MAG: GNAT family N-acetyltransferase [Bacteriovoracia bacterium]